MFGVNMEALSMFWPINQRLSMQRTINMEVWFPSFNQSRSVFFSPAETSRYVRHLGCDAFIARNIWNRQPRRLSGTLEAEYDLEALFQVLRGATFGTIRPITYRARFQIRSKCWVFEPITYRAPFQIRSKWWPITERLRSQAWDTARYDTIDREQGYSGLFGTIRGFEIINTCFTNLRLRHLIANLNTFTPSTLFSLCAYLENTSNELFADWGRLAQSFTGPDNTTS